ncbi:hypothetical protein EMIT0111MI5_110155 [Burkholderia sp. IT-111MI5]
MWLLAFAAQAPVFESGHALLRRSGRATAARKRPAPDRRRSGVGAQMIYSIELARNDGNPFASPSNSFGDRS